MKTNRYLFFSLLFFIFNSCGTNKTSPDRSIVNNKQEPAKESEKKDSTIFFNDTICAYYPSSSKQANWYDFINHMPLETLEKKDWPNEVSLKDFYNQKGELQSILFRDFTLTTSNPVKKYRLDKVYKKVETKNCVYPSIRLYKDDFNNSIVWLSEWDAKDFYQAEHIIINESEVLIDLVQNGKNFFPQPLYKEKLSQEDKTLLLRPLFGTYDLTPEKLGLMPPMDHSRLIITNSFNSIVGNLNFYTNGNKYEYYMANLDIYTWQRTKYERIYQMEWTMNYPKVISEQGIKEVAADKGSFSTSNNQIRIYYINLDKNKKGDFILEFHDVDSFVEALFSSTYSPHF